MQRTQCFLRKHGAFLTAISNHGPVRDRYRSAKLHNKRAVNQGMLSEDEKGGAYTDPTVYRNRTSVDTMLRYDGAVSGIARGQRLNASYGVAGEGRMDDADFQRIEREGGAATPQERKVQARADAEYLGLETAAEMHRQTERGGRAARPGAKQSSYDQLMSKGGASGGGSIDYSNRLHRVLTKESQFERKQRILAKNAIEPSQAEFTTLMRRLAAEDEDMDAVDSIQERLVEENGLYPSMRMDAYMLGDESVFPPWVHKLAANTRDRVKFGGIGLTEDDEAMRIRLSRMPMDKRRVEWDRLKAAKAYAAGTKEQKLTPHEVHSARLAKRQYFRLQMQRQHRATIIKRVALRKPEAVELLPSTQVDYSARLATIAQFVENGVDTKGQWPLDHAELQRAKIRNRQEEAERMFLRTADEKKMLRSSKYISSSIGDALKSLDDKVQRYKRVGRKEYAHRVNNIIQGANDDVGRRYKSIIREASGPVGAVSTERRELERQGLNRGGASGGGDQPEPNSRRFSARRDRRAKNWNYRESNFNTNSYTVPS